MTHLARALKRLMPYRGSAEIARRIGISNSHLTLLRQGKRGVSKDVLRDLAKSVCSSESDRAELIAAHLKDESCGYWPSKIEIAILSGKRSGKREKRQLVTRK